jgi:putative SOS response-associated peptidase YedK
MEQIHNKKKRMPTILNQEQAEAWLNPNLPEYKIKELATSQIDPSLMTAYTIVKTFRTSINPQEAFKYEELE